MSTFVVAGFGRCGSSLAMQMLSAGGVPCVGVFPAFEHKATRHRVDADDIARWDGQAVKVLDPHRVGLPGDVRVVWMSRHPHQQARSFAKFSRDVMGLHYDRQQVRQLERGLMRDNGLALQMLAKRGIPYVVVTFEDLICNPHSAALTMANHFGVPIIAHAAVGAVLPRGTDARPDMRIELRLASAADAMGLTC